MSQHNSEGKQWLWLLIAGFVLVIAGQFLVDVEGWLKAALLGVGGLMIVRCQPWRAKRSLVVPSSREAALFSRRALRQRENKVGLRTRRPVIWEPSTEQQRACEVVAQCLVTRTAGAQIGCQRPSRFWGLGCPKIYHEAEDTLVCIF